MRSGLVGSYLKSALMIVKSLLLSLRSSSPWKEVGRLSLQSQQGPRCHQIQKIKAVVSAQCD